MSYDYRSDIRLVNELVQHSPLHFRNMLLFVVATIQQRLETMPTILASFIDDGSASTWAFGHKRSAIDFIEDHADTIHADALSIRKDPEQLLTLFTTIPGIGLVKAGFIAQLFSNQVGCIDTHNLTLYGVPLNTVRFPKRALPETRQAYIHQYVDLCRGLGGSTYLWSRWCHFLYTQRPLNWANGGEVSYFHYQVISGEIVPDGDVLFLDTDYAPKFLRDSFDITERVDIPF